MGTSTTSDGRRRHIVRSIAGHMHSLGLLAANFALAAMVLMAAPLSAAAHPAQQLVVENTGKLLEALATNPERAQTDGQFLRDTIDTYITSHIDFDAMTKLAVGKRWKQASAAQRKALTAAFRQLLLNTYSKSLTLYSGQKIDFLPFRSGSREDRAVVRSTFTQSGGNDIGIDYRLRSKDKAWKIYDITIDGISLVTNYRTGFNNKIQRDGIDGLIAELREKNRRADGASE